MFYDLLLSNTANMAKDHTLPADLIVYQFNQIVCGESVSGSNMTHTL
jgi:hypothetical protein